MAVKAGDEGGEGGDEGEGGSATVEYNNNNNEKRRFVPKSGSFLQKQEVPDQPLKSTSCLDFVLFSLI